MKKLFDAANRYIETSDWKIIAILKFCLISLGLMAGTQIRPVHNVPGFTGGLSAVAVTSVAKMVTASRLYTEKE